MVAEVAIKEPFARSGDPFFLCFGVRVAAHAGISGPTAKELNLVRWANQYFRSSRATEAREPWSQKYSKSKRVSFARGGMFLIASAGD